MARRKILFYSFLATGGGFAYAALLLSQNSSWRYLFLLIPAAVFAAFSYAQYQRMQREKLLIRLRAGWGTDELKKERDFGYASLVFENMQPNKVAIDERTWQDLNMDLVFAKLDRTLTWPGMQRLYQMLRSPLIDDQAALRRRSTMISSFEDEQEQREEIQLILSKMDDRLGAGLPILLWETRRVPRIHPQIVYTTMGLLALLSPLLLFFGMHWGLAIIFIFQINMYLHFKVQKSIKVHFEGVRALGQLINSAKRLETIRYQALAEPLGKIRELLPQVKRFLKVTRHVGVESSDPLMAMALQYHSIFLLAEVRGFYRALDYIDENRYVLQQLFLAVGELDALQSVASYRTSLKYYCEPEFEEDAQLTLEDGYHPLIVDPVPNSINVRGRGILVTGSNMSGKSTFLRTVGLNILLAQSIATCLAAEYKAIPMRLLTCIGRTDNVVEGKSYYLEEALSVKRVLVSLEPHITTVAIFDEMFRGTNSEERIFAARQVLQYLIARNSMVFVATHDLELADLLSSNYRSVHFSERVGTHGLEFDYKLKEGPATTKNAIALLRYLEYPREITEGEMPLF